MTAVCRPDSGHRYQQRYRARTLKILAKEKSATDFLKLKWRYIASFYIYITTKQNCQFLVLPATPNLLSVSASIQGNPVCFNCLKTFYSQSSEQAVAAHGCLETAITSNFVKPFTFN